MQMPEYDRLIAAQASCDQSVRQAHEAIKDLKQLHREVQETIKSWKDTAEAIFNVQVRTEGEKLAQAVKIAIEDATNRVYKRFDKIAAILMGQDKGGTGPDLETLARRVRASMDDAGLR
jgi:DNA anti-recombination protein RmuC